MLSQTPKVLPERVQNHHKIFGNPVQTCATQVDKNKKQKTTNDLNFDNGFSQRNEDKKSIKNIYIKIDNNSLKNRLLNSHCNYALFQSCKPGRKDPAIGNIRWPH